MFDSLKYQSINLILSSVHLVTTLSFDSIKLIHRVYYTECILHTDWYDSLIEHHTLYERCSIADARACKDREIKTFYSSSLHSITYRIIIIIKKIYEKVSKDRALSQVCVDNERKVFFSQAIWQLENLEKSSKFVRHKTNRTLCPALKWVTNLRLLTKCLENKFAIS